MGGAASGSVGVSEPASGSVGVSEPASGGSPVSVGAVCGVATVSVRELACPPLASVAGRVDLVEVAALPALDCVELGRGSDAFDVPVPTVSVKEHAPLAATKKTRHPVTRKVALINTSAVPASD